MIWKNKTLKLIKDKFGRTILITIDFIADNLYFFIYFMLRKSTIKNYICEQISSTPKVLAQDCSIINRFLFGCICV